MIRAGIIGIGNMGSAHANHIFDGLVKNMTLAAVCDINPDRIKWAKEHFGDKVQYFDNSDEFYKHSDLIDLVIIATPHYSHSPLAIEGFNHNLHVLTEKPAGVYTKQVREMNEAAEKSDKKFFIMYNQRIQKIARFG